MKLLDLRTVSKYSHHNCERRTRMLILGPSMLIKQGIAMTHSDTTMDMKAPTRRAYAPPALVNYGALAVLTAGGSKGNTENSFINQMLCGTNPLAKCG